MKNTNLFENMPAESKVWVFAANRKFTDEEQSAMNELGKNFSSGWISHEQKVVSEFAFLHHAFFVVMVDENACHLGGCGADDLFRFVKSLGHHFQIDFMNRLQVELLVDDEVTITTKADAAKLYREGIINEQAVFFNKNILRKNEFDSSFEIPFSQSWVYKGMKQMQSV